jgi:hypothetical protein
MKQQLINFYLDWVNNFLSIQYFASYHDLTVKQATTMINVGRELHEQVVSESKLTEKV